MKDVKLHISILNTYKAFQINNYVKRAHTKAEKQLKKSRTGPLSDSPSVACDEESLIDMIQVTSYFLFLSERVKLVLSGKAPRALNENKSATFAIT